ncbi:cation:proton antiporter domain-containing protein [Amphiplicatus metriothermophilus]|uniref:Kef-type potassium/proton antiporter, CPA2 family n=1 Tax=Amphiplicatus metriothermophilus TaxID=1519374 RepID=A0A239PWQ9_9PROT|nr:cation:proton antiporter [Amphiplicatus metriothermophilus]MBB5519069.1 CPA2 family monovalent cation:H+ antiporter-2 [Amphiplicatus metriothermophilus]SNT74761.1 Kef-type potassium/proton antiporter, CPA2 family [Amphiplicatus metriothermophilus]
MSEQAPLTTTIVVGLGLAFILGAFAHRLKLPPLVGYLLAGVAVGPYTPGFVADQAIGAQLAELGVILLMFGVGLSFSPRDLMSVRALAVPGAIGQILIATLLGAGLGLAMGWSPAGAFLFGFALSIASTVVLLKSLQDRRLIETERGRLAVGWAIVEDLLTVFALVLIPPLARLAGAAAETSPGPLALRLFGPEAGVSGALALTLLKVVAFVGVMFVIGRRIIPWVLHEMAHTGSRELFRLAVLATALGVALGSSLLFDVSLALGAFFAGMILAESELSQRAAQETLPLRDAFAVLFFVSVGMLFDPAIVLRDPLALLAVVFVIVVARAAITLVIVGLFRHPLSTGLVIAASRAQIGEFSFILASIGVGLGVFPERGQDLIIAGALISILLNPLAFWALPALERGLQAPLQRVGLAPPPRETAAPAQEPAPAAEPEAPAQQTSKTGHAIVVGYGRVGKAIAEELGARGIPYVVIEDAAARVDEARAAGAEVIVGNGAMTETLSLANAGEARCLLVAIPNVFEAGSATEEGRRLNPGMPIIVRAQTDDEEAHLKHLGASMVVLGGREVGLGMLSQLDAAVRAQQKNAASEAEEASAASAPPATPEPAVEPAAETELDER